MSNLKSNFERKGFVTIPYPDDLHKRVLRLAEVWKKWCSLDSEIKKLFSYEDGVGYEFQDTHGNTRDLKEVFHFTGEKEEWLTQQAKNSQSKVAQELVATSREVLEHLFPEILKYNREIEKEYGLTGLVTEIKESKNTVFIRAIHYFPGKKAGEIHAAHHVDKSGQTEHLYEDYSGVECLGSDGVWRPMPTWSDEMVAFGSMQMQLRSKNKIKALCHRVVATNESGEHGRFAIVAFTQLAKTPTYNKKHRGRLQDLPAGFNYTLPLNEFKKFFA